MFRALAHKFSISSEDETLLDQGKVLLARLSAPSQPSVVYDLRMGAGDAEVLIALVGNINFAAIAKSEGELLLHAGALSRSDGSAVAICAPSGGGKSTLTARLAQRGYSYITDETLCINPATLRITPFQKPLSLKPGSQHLFPELRPSWALEGRAWLIAPQLLGCPPPPPTPLLPELLIFPRYETGASTSVERLGDGEASFLMGKESSRLAHVHGGPLQALARVARRATAYRIVHGDADAAADRVVSLWEAA